MTPATTGITNTNAAVAMLKWERRGSMAAPRPTAAAIPVAEPTRFLRIYPLSYETGLPASASAVKNLLRRTGSCSEPVQGRRQIIVSMADFLVALGIIGFALVFLGLIWALDRV